MLKHNSLAPDFSLPGQDGKTHTLSGQKGKLVLVYFYPKDDTPGCTTEACDFRDHMEMLASANCVVFGVSKDSLNSHQKFSDKYQLNFTLLSDEALQAHKAYEVLIDGKIVRSTFLIDTQGKIIKIWSKVSAKGHVADVLATIQSL